MHDSIFLCLQILENQYTNTHDINFCIYWEF